jgi:hypothetical protein
MRQATLPLPEIGIIAATRGMLGAGVALLLADKIEKERRMKIALPLLVIGVASTVPLLLHVLKSQSKAV